MNCLATIISNVSFASILSLTLMGCSRQMPQPPSAALPTVQVAVPIKREVTDYADFTGRTSAVNSVEVRARVDGYLDSVPFKAGALVQKGDVLFVIDQRPFVAELNRAKAQLAEAEAQYKQALTKIDDSEAARTSAEAGLDYARRKLARSTQLVPNGAVSREEFELDRAKQTQAEADLQRALAGIAAAKAAVASATATEQTARAAIAIAELNLNYTTVTAPVSGRVSRHFVTVGNLVQAGQNGGGTLLTTIVSVDPIHANFDVDEYTVQRVQQMIREGLAKSAREDETPVWLGLAHEEGFPHRGSINFIDNQVRPSTGTLRVRGVFPNHDDALVPGYFARIRVPIGNPHKALLIVDRALETDQGQKVVFFVGKENKVESRPVRLGAMHDGLREIVEGLEPGERVIVNGLQQVQPGMTVNTTQVSMPNSGPLNVEITAQPASVATVKATANLSSITE